jgi:MraZ protein
VFLGTFRHQVDGKGRVAVPAQFRRGLPDGSVIAIGPDERLMMYPADEWTALEQHYRRTSETKVEERRLIRQLFGLAREIELDAQGRLLLAPEHRDFAKIRDRAVFIGIGNMVEVVGEDVWDGETAALDAASFTELHDTVNQRGAAAQPPPA